MPPFDWCHRSHHKLTCDDLRSRLIKALHPRQTKTYFVLKPIREFVYIVCNGSISLLEFGNTLPYIKLFLASKLHLPLNNSLRDIFLELDKGLVYPHSEFKEKLVFYPNMSV